METSRFSPLREKLIAGWEKVKRYVPIALIALASTASSRSEAQSSSGGHAANKEASGTKLDIGKGTDKDPWKYKLPRTDDGDHVVVNSKYVSSNKELKEKLEKERFNSIVNKRAEHKKFLEKKLEEAQKTLEEKKSKNTTTKADYQRVVDYQLKLAEYDRITGMILRGEIYDPKDIDTSNAH